VAETTAPTTFDDRAAADHGRSLVRSSVNWVRAAGVYAAPASGPGLNTLAVGLVTGNQVAASLISRVWPGHYAESKAAEQYRLSTALT
jgi:hypothetical protein